MGRSPNYHIETITSKIILLRDIGPWNKHLTITNGAEEVVEQMVSQLNGRRLGYYDSEGELTELLIKDGKFYDFAPWKE